ncbi:hypothetical protein [Salinicola aestuarinus]|uniref:hypothetical protein n=1 Tax=Salinicola aestuarinus TaxID=1949082 RepID=UPI000DA121C6|nr:hypothetical protein [Salinicola aestuarinus]
MADITLDSLLDTFDLSQSQRLLTFELGGTSPIPHCLVGGEQVSKPFRNTLDCISQQGDIELKTLMAQAANLLVLQAVGSYCRLHGLVNQAGRHAWKIVTGTIGAVGDVLAFYDGLMKLSDALHDRRLGRSSRSVSLHDALGGTIIAGCSVFRFLRPVSPSRRRGWAWRCAPSV